MLSSCTVCLGDYTEDEDVRVLPCRHNFHSMCTLSFCVTAIAELIPAQASRSGLLSIRRVPCV